MKVIKRVLKTVNLVENDWKILGIPLCSRDGSRVLNYMEKSLAIKQKKVWIATVNPEFVMNATKDKDFLNILNKTSLNVIDGIGLVWAREIDLRSHQSKNILKRVLIGFQVGVEVLKGEHREKLASGSDLVDKICRLAAKENYKIYFLGGFDDRAERTAKYFQNKYQTNTECSPGEPQVSNDEVIKKINGYKPDVLFVAYGMKKQEEWIAKNLSRLDVGIVVGVGRSFDYYSGDLKRAPLIWRKMGLEWLYSLIKEPKRIKRQVELPKFVWKVLVN